MAGGTSNAAGDYSFAAGRRAKANHAGSFVFADNKNFDFATGGPNSSSCARPATPTEAFHPPHWPHGTGLSPRLRVGDLPKGITTVDAAGVALAAIQGLYRRSVAQQRELGVQRQQIAGLKRENARLVKLERTVTALKRKVR